MNDVLTIGFLRTLWILRDYLNEIIVGGGWAPFLYYRYLLQNTDHEPVRTGDIDLMVKKQIPIVGDKTVGQLLCEAGFEAKFKSRDNPALIHYEGIIEGVGVDLLKLLNCIQILIDNPGGIFHANIFHNADMQILFMLTDRPWGDTKKFSTLLN